MWDEGTMGRRPGARRGKCGRRRERLTVEMWYRALNYGPGNPPAFGSPYLIGAVETRTEFGKTSSHGQSDVTYFDGARSRPATTSA